MANTQASTEKFQEALALLNDAARDRGEELKKLAADKYTDLKAVLTVATNTSADWIKDRSKAAADTAKRAASTVDDSVHENPWPWIGGTAVVALVLGFLLGRWND